jgi:hypothetical protein
MDGWLNRKSKDGETDMTKLTGALCNFANMSKENYIGMEEEGH